MIYLVTNVVACYILFYELIQVHHFVCNKNSRFGPRSTTYSTLCTNGPSRRDGIAICEVKEDRVMGWAIDGSSMDPHNRVRVESILEFAEVYGAEDGRVDDISHINVGCR